MEDTCNIYWTQVGVWRNRITSLFLHQRNMEYGVDFGVWLKIQAISNCANALLHLEWTIIFGCEFVKLSSSHRLLAIRLELDVYPVTNIENLLCSPFIILCFMWFWASCKFASNKRSNLLRSCNAWSTECTIVVPGRYDWTDGGWTSYNACNGNIRMTDWNVVLYHHATQGRSVAHLCGRSAENNEVNVPRCD